MYRCHKVDQHPRLLGCFIEEEHSIRLEVDLGESCMNQGVRRYRGERSSDLSPSPHVGNRRHLSSSRGNNLDFNTVKLSRNSIIVRED
jgi:hypothetical protein